MGQIDRQYQAWINFQNAIERLRQEGVAVQEFPNYTGVSTIGTVLTATVQVDVTNILKYEEEKCLTSKLIRS